jgi:pilus assembly protein CpaB
MNRRILTIVAAVLLAIVGTGAVYAYVKNADTRAVAGSQPVSVLIVDKRIPAGTPASNVESGGYVHTDHLPSDATPRDAVASIGGDWQSDVATADIQPGQVLLRPMFGEKVPTTSGLAIPNGMVAVSVKLTADGDVAGYVQPGSEIAVFDTFVLLNGSTTIPSGSKSGGGGNGNDNWATKLLLPRVSVLAVSQAAPTGTTNGLNSNSGGTATLLVTVAVNQMDAERLIHIAQTGMPYAALLSSTSQVAPAPGVDNHAQLGPVFPANGRTTAATGAGQ